MNIFPINQITILFLYFQMDDAVEMEVESEGEEDDDSEDEEEKVTRSRPPAESVAQVIFFSPLSCKLSTV